MDHKELSRLADLCRKKGITHIKTTLQDSGQPLELTFKDLPTRSRKSRKAQTASAELPDIESQYTQEQILNWSAPGFTPEQLTEES